MNLNVTYAMMDATDVTFDACIFTTHLLSLEINAR